MSIGMSEQNKCNHVDHIKKDETVFEFLKRNKNINKSVFLGKKLRDNSVYIGMKIENRNITFS